MEKYRLTNDGGKDVSFTGEKIAVTASSPDNSHPYFSGSTGRWKTLRLFRTKAGKYICQEVGHTQWQGEKERNWVSVCDTEEEVIEFFKLGDLAKEIYSQAGINCTREIE